MEHPMRVCVIAAAVIAITQPAAAAKADAKHRNHVAHLSHHHYAKHRTYIRLRRVPIEDGYAMAPSFARPDAFGAPAFGGPFVQNRRFRSQSFQSQSFQNQPWRQTWAAANPQMPFGASGPGGHSELDSMIERHATANGVPADLVRRVVMRESRYNPGARNGSNLGLMQIKHATARGVGYNGPASGLMDPETNLTYAVRYLAGAYRAAGGNPNRAVALYASGYHGRGEPRKTPVAAMSWQMQPQPVAERW
jgi:soluble lytic murein transglycosylase-like protein